MVIEGDDGITCNSPVTMKQGLTVEGESDLSGGANIGGIPYGTHYHDAPDGRTSEPKKG